MKVMCFTEEEIADVLQVIAGVLQLGNVNFMDAGGAQVAEKSGRYWLLLKKLDFLCPIPLNPLIKDSMYMHV